MKKIVYTLSVLIIGISCGKNEDTSITNKFIIHASEIINFSNDEFIMATSPKTGEVFYWDIGKSFEDNIEFEVENTQTVDLTFGLEFDIGFRIITYRDIKSGFKLSRYLFPCFEDEYKIDSLNIRNVELIIKGTTEIIEIANPLYITSDFPPDTSSLIEVKNKIIYDYEKDITIIRGDLGSSNMDIQFTFLFSGDEDYKSIILKQQDWVKIDDRKYNKEILKEDLNSSNLYEIDVGVDDSWLIDSEILTKNGNRIRIARWSNSIENQKGKKIKLFLENGIDVGELTLELRPSSFSPDGFHYQNKFDKIPISISLKEFQSEVVELTSKSFNVSISNDYELFRIKYQYNTDNFLSAWYIYQTSSSTLDYDLPTIISEYLDKNDKMKNSLLTPERCFIQTYSIDEEGFEDKYQETGINRQLLCLKFNSSYESIEF